MMFLMMHQPHLHQPWRLDRCNPFIHSFLLRFRIGAQPAGWVWAAASAPLMPSVSVSHVTGALVLYPALQGVRDTAC